MAPLGKGQSDVIFGHPGVILDYPQKVWSLKTVRVWLKLSFRKFICMVATEIRVNLPFISKFKYFDVFSRLGD